MPDQDRDYLARRREACLTQAQASPDASIAKVHRSFAAEYDRRLNGEPPGTLRIVAPS